MPAGPLARWIGGIVGDGWSKVVGERDINSASVGMSSLFHFHDSARARKELRYQTRDVAETLDQAADWIKSHHM